IEVERIQSTLEARCVVQRLAECIGRWELQAVRETLLKQRLERVVVRVSDGFLAEDPRERGHARDGALESRQGIAQRRRIFAQADERYATRTNHRTRS